MSNSAKFENQSDLRKAVETRLGQQVPDDEWNRIIDYAAPYDGSDMNDALKALKERGFEPIKQEKPISADGAIAKWLLQESLSELERKAVEKFRLKHFGLSTPPFKTLNDAADWIEAQEGEYSHRIELDLMTLILCKIGQFLNETCKIRGSVNGTCKIRPFLIPESGQTIE